MKPLRGIVVILLLVPGGVALAQTAPGYQQLHAQRVGVLSGVRDSGWSLVAGAALVADGGARVVDGKDGIVVAFDSLQRYPLVDESQERWVVLDPHAKYVDQLVLPQRFQLLVAGADYALGVYRDEDDVEHVRLYRFSPRSGGPH